MTLNTKQKGYLSDLSLLFVAAVWGGGFVAVKDALNSVTPMLLMALRFIFASVIMYTFLFKWIGKVTIKDFKKGSVVGLILFTAFAFQTYGLKYTTASKQGFLTATYVVMVPLVYWMLYKKRPKLKAFIGSFITIIGIGLISLENSLSLGLGDSLTLVCALFFALHILSIEYFTKNMDAAKLAFVQLVVASILFSIATVLTEPINLNLPTQAWYSIIYLAIFSTFACFTVQTIAQKHTTSSHASIIMSLESVFAAVFGVLILGEIMTPLLIVGCGLIFIAILIIETNVSFEKFIKKDKVA